MDKEGRVIGSESGLLGAACDLGLVEVMQLIRAQGGLMVACHVDRPCFSIPSQFGFFPDEVRFDAIEISPAGRLAGRRREFDDVGPPVICSSDSHYLSEIGVGATLFDVGSAGFEELTFALGEVNGRRVWDA